jgi:transposase-like protein
MVQCLGHAYNVLRHAAYAHLRESIETTQQYCPANPDVRAFFLELADEVLDVLGPVRRFHVGGDETRRLGVCPACRDRVAAEGVAALYGRQRYACRPCGRTFTAASGSAFAGYRWPPDVLLMAVRWYLAHPLSATSVTVLLAERGIDVSERTVLRWVQTFGPLLAAEVRKHRRRRGRTWYVDEVFFFRGGGQAKRYLYRAADEHGQVLDVLFRD